MVYEKSHSKLMTIFLNLTLKYQKQVLYIEIIAYWTLQYNHVTRQPCTRKSKDSLNKQYDKFSRTFDLICINNSIIYNNIASQ
jgi:hypothetical protein